MLIALRIIGPSVLVTILFGIVHDQVTVRLCVEYFTIGHSRIIASESPTILGFVWGVVATWWVGLILGVPLAVVAARGKRPKRTAKSLIRPIGILLVCMACTSLVAGFVGYALANNGSTFLVEPLASRVPAERHAMFLAVGGAHLASYLAGFVGGLVLILRTRKARKFDASHAEAEYAWAVLAMKSKGIPFGPGLTDDWIRHAEETHSFLFPPDPKSFFQFALRRGDSYSDTATKMRQILDRICSRVWTKALAMRSTTSHAICMGPHGAGETPAKTTP
jgi:hypothetical protein